MQICYRCEEKTNRLLEKTAQENGVSKNHLIDEIIKSYLKQNQFHTPSLHNKNTEKLILSDIQHANEQLTQVLEELNNLQAFIERETDMCTLKNSFEVFRICAIQILLNIAKSLEITGKAIYPSDRK